MTITTTATEPNPDTRLHLEAGQRPRTQKGKGIVALTDHEHPVPVFRIYRRTLETLQAATGIVFPLWHPIQFPLFARPCPKTPRHGFVDSKVVKTGREMLDLWIEAMQQDPDAEMLIMPMIYAQWNAVLTPSSFTLGRGHDGATSGRKTVGFPLVRTLHPVNEGLLADAEIDDLEDPYIEAVLPFNWRELYGGDLSENTKTTHWQVTQLRAGPTIKGESADYIPYTVPEVTHLLRPDGESLLEWEKRMKGLPVGTVIWHKHGSLTSHYAIHAQLCGVPFVTTKKPKVGAVLHATTDTLEKRKSAEVIKGVAYGDILGRGVGAYNVRSQVILALAGLYNSHKMRGSHSFWIGVSAAILLRLGTMALRGEARHLGQKRLSRGSVYRSYAKRSLTFHALHCREWSHIFAKGNFNNHSIGGKKWAECAKGVEELVFAIRALARRPSAVTVKRLLIVLNRVVDLAHNNGWWLNKFANGEVYTKVQQGDLLTLLECGQFIPMVAGIAKGLSSAKQARLLALYQSWDPQFPKLNVRISHPRIDTISHSHMTVKLQAYDDLLKDHRKPERVTIHAEDWHSALSKLVNENIHIDEPENAESEVVTVHYGKKLLARLGED